MWFSNAPTSRGTQTRDTCWGTGGYNDIRSGAQVVITDAASTTVAVGSITTALPVMDQSASDGGELAAGCSFGFTVENVPAGHQSMGWRSPARDGCSTPETS